MKKIWEPQPDRDIQCVGCIFYINTKKCSVFPLGIPEKIWTSKHDHRKPYKGDGGIRFEAITKQ